jgi:hypothetical protein
MWITIHQGVKLGTEPCERELPFKAMFFFSSLGEIDGESGDELKGR